MASHTRNVAGHKLTKVTNAVYRQDCGDGKYRLFIRYFERVKRIGKPKDFYWRYTPITDEQSVIDKQSKQSYPTLTAAVMAVN